MQLVYKVASFNRERGKIFSEALILFSKNFPSIPSTSKKRSRSDVLSSDRSNTLLLSDRSVLGSSMGKMGTQSNAIMGGFELGQQKSEERTKSAVPSKRTRTSLVDGKVCILEFSLLSRVTLRHYLSRIVWHN